MKETWHDRLYTWMSEKGLNTSKIENLAEFSHGTLQKALKGKKSLGSDKIEKILHLHPDLNANWLLRGTGEMFISEQQQTMSMVAEDFVVYLKKSKSTQEVLKELHNYSQEARFKELVQVVDTAINELSLENSTLKNKLLKLYEAREELIKKVEELL